MIESVLSRMTTRKAHLAGLIGVLIAMFILTGVVAHTARETHRAAVERAEAQLVDYAHLAQVAWTGRVRSGLQGVLTETLGPAADALRLPAGERPPLAEVTSLLTDSAGCFCVERRRMRRVFLIDFRTGQVEIRGGPAEAAFATRLLGRVRDHPFTQVNTSWGVDIWATEEDGATWINGFLAQLDADGAPFSAIGFQAPPAVIADILGTTLDFGPLLDRRVMNEMNNADVLAATVTDPFGRVIFSSAGDPRSPYAAQDTLRDLLSGAILSVAILSATAPRLLAGGMPASPLPLVLVLLGLNGALVLVAVLLLRREDEVARLRSDFIAGVSHELRTPLAQIRMFAETLLLGRVRSAAERDKSLEIIDQEARRLTMLVENVLLYARAERRHVRIDPAPADLAADIREAVQGFALLHRSRAIEVRTELQENVIAPVDAGALKQMLLNLLDNAVKYGPPGQRITVGMALFGSRVRTWVDDEGPGIPKAERERIFDPFFRLRRDQESAIAGSGIGLAIVRELAGLHAGTVTVDDAPGGGTRVIIELPGAYLRPTAASDAFALT